MAPTKRRTRLGPAAARSADACSSPRGSQHESSSETSSEQDLPPTFPARPAALPAPAQRALDSHSLDRPSTTGQSTWMPVPGPLHAQGWGGQAAAAYWQPGPQERGSSFRAWAPESPEGSHGNEHVLAGLATGPRVAQAGPSRGESDVTRETSATVPAAREAKKDSLNERSKAAQKRYRDRKRAEAQESRQQIGELQARLAVAERTAAGLRERLASELEVKGSLLRERNVLLEEVASLRAAGESRAQEVLPGAAPEHIAALQTFLLALSDTSSQEIKQTLDALRPPGGPRRH